MITSVSVRNFQSLKSIDVEVGQFTVIVGSSSSGKSAFVRAMRALVSNIRGSDYVTRGEKHSTVRASLEDGTTVTLERGDGVGSYTLDPNVEFADTLKFTKLAGSVPEDVIRFLKINADLCFSQQFDSPYLLTESGAVVARALGELTNVSTIFSAAKEGNRVRLGHSGKLKTRQTDLESLINKAQEYKTLGTDQAQFAQAEASFAEAEKTNLRISQLRDLISKCQIAESVLTRTVLPEVPSFDAVGEAFERLSQARTSLASVAAAEKSARQTDELVTQAEAEERALNEELRLLLVSAGVCPTCNQNIEEGK